VSDFIEPIKGAEIVQDDASLTISLRICIGGETVVGCFQRKAGLQWKK
jgi:hypothetical protein